MNLFKKTRSKSRNSSFDSYSSSDVSRANKEALIEISQANKLLFQPKKNYIHAPVPLPLAKPSSYNNNSIRNGSNSNLIVNNESQENINDAIKKDFTNSNSNDKKIAYSHSDGNLSLVLDPININNTSNNNDKNNNNYNQSNLSSVDAETKRNKDFTILLSASVINVSKIKNLSWQGIPDQYRPKIWRLLLDYEHSNVQIRESTLNHKRKDYFACIKKVFGDNQKKLWTTILHRTQDQILRDLPRTKDPRLRTPIVQSIFERVLFLWAYRHPASGYVQGMNDLLQPFFYVFMSQFYSNISLEKQIDEEKYLREIKDVSRYFDDIEKHSKTETDLMIIEADCFWCFTKLLDGLQDLYTREQPGVYKMLEKLRHIIQRVDPKLAKHFEDEGIQFHEFAFRWINCLFVREFEMPLVLRIWDNYISNPTTIANQHVYFCAALLTFIMTNKKFADKDLGSLPHGEFIVELQSLEPARWCVEDVDEIIAQAYVYEKMFLLGHGL